MSCMQRNMDLARRILLEMEAYEHGNAPREFHTLDDFSLEQISYHVWLLGNAGLMETQQVTHMQSASPEAIPISLTWAGHEFLDAARNETMWKRALQKVKSSGVPVTFEVLKQVLVAFSKTELAKHGIQL